MRLSDGLNKVIIRIVELFVEKKSNQLPLDIVKQHLLEEYSVQAIVDEAISLAHDMDVISVIAEGSGDDTVNWCHFPGIGDDD